MTDMPPGMRTHIRSCSFFEVRPYDLRLEYGIGFLKPLRLKGHTEPL